MTSDAWTIGDRQTTVAAVLMIASFGLSIATLELLFNWRHLRDEGLFGWRVLGSRTLLVSSPARERIATAVLGFPGIVVLLCVRLVALAGLLIPALRHAASPFLLGLVVAISLLINYRHAWGQDGSDNMFTVVFVSLLPAAAFPDRSGVVDLCLGFLAFQACLSYSAAGIVKIAGPAWRTGKAVAAIFGTRSYGHPGVAAFLQRQPAFAAVLTWSVVAVETLFPLALILPAPYVHIFLLWGVAFHASNAAIMGLNTFFWAFIATYPAILYCNAWLAGRL